MEAFKVVSVTCPFRGRRRPATVADRRRLRPGYQPLTSESTEPLVVVSGTLTDPETIPVFAFAMSAHVAGVM